MRCEYKTIKKIRLCPADLTHEVSIRGRVIQGDKPGSSGRTTDNAIATLWVAIETVNPLRPIQGYNEGDKPTHVVYVRYDDLTVVVDTQKHIIKKGDEIYRIVGIENLNELNTTIALYCVNKKTGIEAQS